MTTPAAALTVLVLLLKITGVLLAALGTSLVMQRASAGARHLVWLVALAGLVAVPALGAWGPLPIRVLPEAFAPAAPPPATPLSDASSVRPPLVTPAVTSPAETERGAATRRPSPAAGLPGPGTLLLAVWALVAFTLAVRLGYGAWSVRRIAGRARPLDDANWQRPLYEIADRLGLERVPRLLRSDEVKMPFAAGLVASTIVLPAESDGWSAERRSAVLIHELAHVRRRDLIGHTIGRVACALYWFHPLVWTAARRLRAESERACDDFALVFGTRPSDYAEHLLDIVACVRDHCTPSVALAMAHRKEFEGRMLAILNPELHRRAPSRAQTVSLVGALGTLALVVGAAAPVTRAARPSTSAASSSLTPPAGPQARVVFADTAAHPPAPVRSEPARVARRAAAPAASQQVVDTGSSQQSDDERAAVLAKTLRTDANPTVRRVAAWGLKRYADDEVALNALVAAIASDADGSVREMAAWSLAGARRSSTASAALVKALRQDRNPEVHATAVWALGSIGDESAVEALAGALADSDPPTREMAAWAIGACRPDHTPARLVGALSDHDRDVRLSAAWALYAIHDPATIGALDAAYHHETDDDVRVGLIRALGAMGEASVDALQRLVTSPDSAVRAVAVTELAGGGASGPWPWPRPQPRPFP